jgi:hypothetical protein
MLPTIDECRRAKAALDPIGGAVTQGAKPNTPKGCSIHDGKWYFNEHATGKSDDFSELVCKPTVTFQAPDKPCQVHTMLTTIDECRRARAALNPKGDAVVQESRATTPKGCSYFDGKWYFNDHPTGRSDGVTEPVCKSEGVIGKSNKT